MFQNIILRRADDGQPISFGQVAEALLYYQNVHLIIDRGTLTSLIKQIGTGRLLSLLGRPGFTAVYCEEILATKTDSVGSLQAHQFVALMITGNQTIGKFKSLTERIQYSLEQEGISRAEAKRFAKVFVNRVPARKLSGDHFIDGGIPAAGKNDLLDPSFRHEAIKQVIASIPGGYEAGDSIKIEIVDSDLGMYVFHNIDLERINRYRATQSATPDNLTVAHLLNNVLEARADLALASHYGGDFTTSAITSSILQTRYSEILRRSNLNINARQQFSEVTLPDSPTIAEVIDSGERSFDEFFLLLDKAARFKTWLAAVNPDENLVRTYLTDVTSESWIQRLPVKTMRYLFTIALDAANPIAGLVAGFTDTFLMDKLLGGWRPNHFVSSRLGPFIGSVQH